MVVTFKLYLSSEISPSYCKPNCSIFLFLEALVIGSSIFPLKFAFTNSPVSICTSICSNEYAQALFLSVIPSFKGNIFSAEKTPETPNLSIRSPLAENSIRLPFSAVDFVLNSEGRPIEKFSTYTPFQLSCAGKSSPLVLYIFGKTTEGSFFISLTSSTAFETKN